MPLTPTDVANKQFRISFRGYSLDEVDAFLDEVENELTRLLRTDESKGRSSSSAPAAAVGAAVPAAARPPLSGMEGQEAALRTLLLAQRTADEAIAEARAEADELVSSARAEAEQAVSEAKAEAEQAVSEAKAEADRTLSSAKAEADRTLGGARTEADRTLSTSRERAARLDEDVAAKIQAATGDLDQQRRQLESRIEELRAFEREYRTRLKAYLETQLRELHSGSRPSDEAGSGVPADARAAAVGGGSTGRPAAAPVPVPVVAPGRVPAPSASTDDEPAEGAADSPADAPDGPPRESDTAALRAVPPLAAPGSPVGPFTVVSSHDADAGEAPGDR